MSSDPFVRRLLVAAALTAAGLALAPIASDFGLLPADSARSLVWLALALFGVSYLAVVAVSLLWVVVRPERERSAITDGALAARDKPLPYE